MREKRKIGNNGYSTNFQVIYVRDKLLLSQILSFGMQYDNTDLVALAYFVHTYVIVNFWTEKLLNQ